MSDKPKKPPVKLTDKQREALDKGRKSFTRGDPWSQEVQKKATEKAVEARQEQAQKRTFAALLAEALAITNADGKTRKHGIAEGLTKALEKELAKKNPNGKTVNALYTAIRDTIGEMPSQKIDVNANVKTIGNWRDLPSDGASETNTGDNDTNSDNAAEGNAETAPDATTETTETAPPPVVEE